MDMKILIVDHSDANLMLLQEILGDYTLLTAKSGNDALELFSNDEEIDMVIMELDLPDINGFELLMGLQTSQKKNAPYVIVLTNTMDKETEAKAIALGVADYIQEPIDGALLKAKIDCHIALMQVEKDLTNKLHQQTVAYKSIYEQVPVGIAISHSMNEPEKANQLLSFNPAFEKITGRTKEELFNIGWAAITHPDDLEADFNNFRRLKAGEISGYSMDKRFVRPDGSVAWVHMIASALNFDDAEGLNHVAIFTDITESKEKQKQLIESERSKTVLLSHLPGMAYRCDYDRDWTMHYVSSGCEKLTGYPAENLIGNKLISFNTLILPKYREILWHKWKEIVESKTDFEYEYEIQTASGEIKWVLELAQVTYNESGAVDALEGIIIDITDRKKMESALKHNYDHDRWTGLYNRSYLEEFLRKEIVKIDNLKRALIGIHLEDLQRVTMVYGFQYSQNVILRVAEALSTLADLNHILAKTYDNMFVFYVQDYQSKEELLAFANEVVEKLKSVLTLERVGGGLGVFEIDTRERLATDAISKKLLLAAEKASQDSENDFKICVYDSSLDLKVIRNKVIEEELQRVAHDPKDGGLYLMFQPVFDIKQNRVYGFEALARLKSDELGYVSPMDFIPIAEKTKLIIPIGYKIFRLAFEFMSQMKENGHTDLNISINISLLQLLRDDFCDSLLKMMDEMNIPHQHVGLEITESIFEGDYLVINEKLKLLKEKGLKIYIDDFGTGYSSLARESELNVDFLKLDKYFFNTTNLNPKKSIVPDVISMAQKFDHYVIAEGVETQEQLNFLKKCKCSYIQGYLISNPLDPQEAIVFLKKYPRKVR